jgi:hypothetical protein
VWVTGETVDTSLSRTSDDGAVVETAVELPFGAGVNPALGVVGAGEALFRVTNDGPTTGTYQVCVAIQLANGSPAPTPFPGGLVQVVGEGRYAAETVPLDPGLWRIGITGLGSLEDPAAAFHLRGRVGAVQTVASTPLRDASGMIPLPGRSPPDAGLMGYGAGLGYPELVIDGTGPYLVLGAADDAVTEDADVSFAYSPVVTVAGASDGETTRFIVPNLYAGYALSSLRVTLQAQTVGAMAAPSVSVNVGSGYLSLAAQPTDATRTFQVAAVGGIEVLVFEPAGQDPWFLTLEADP